MRLPSRLLMAWGTGWAIALVAAVLWGYDGPASLVFQSLCAAVVSAVCLVAVLLAGLILRVRPIARFWHARRSWVGALAAACLAVMCCGSALGLTGVYADPETGQRFVALHPAAALLSYLLLLFALAHWPQRINDDKLLDTLSDEAFRRMSAVDDNLQRMEEPYRTIAIIYSAQGVIDNGGLVYFFANDWPHRPPYSEYADAYERIGCIDAANALRSAAESFPIERPELHREQRRAYIEANYEESTFEVKGWDDCICGDEQVWKNLAAWARTHRVAGH